MLKKEKWLVDERFSNKNNRKKNKNLLIAELQEILKTKTAEQWEILANNFKVPAARVLSLKESLNLKQNCARNFIHEFDSDNLKVLTLPFRFNNQKNHPPITPPSRLGQNTVDILKELGFKNYQIKLFKKNNVVFFEDK